jgi:hypothetical protein
MHVSVISVLPGSNPVPFEEVVENRWANHLAPFHPIGDRRSKDGALTQPEDFPRTFPNPRECIEGVEISKGSSDQHVFIVGADRFELSTPAL